tara:strand:+ start:1583 stop:1795 length:213 start_codon:yes stop_codon:yes gene_type:complete
MAKTKKAVNKKDEDPFELIHQALSEILESIKDLDERISELEEHSHKPIDYEEYLDNIHTRLSKVENRMGL